MRSSYLAWNACCDGAIRYRLLRRASSAEAGAETSSPSSAALPMALAVDAGGWAVVYEGSEQSHVDVGLDPQGTVVYRLQVRIRNLCDTYQ